MDKLDGLPWRTSSYSGSNGGNCVEVATTTASTVAVRDSKYPHGPVLAFGPQDWQRFAAQVKAGSL
jgi:Domain of unknown function (DUF397)